MEIKTKSPILGEKTSQITTCPRCGGKTRYDPTGKFHFLACEKCQHVFRFE